MQIDKRVAHLIAELEYLIGSECYNPNSYDGWNDVEGCDYRYPVNIRKSNGEFAKIRRKINDTALIDKKDITPEAIKYMKYKFGSNELFIGLGLIKVLEYLEQRYGLDFNALEATQNE